MPNNTVPILFKLSGLLKRLNYVFEVEGLGGNWPATVTPSSGAFTAISKSGTINGAVSFCATTGQCLQENGVLPYDMAKTCTFDQSQVFTFVRMKAMLDDDPTIYVYSDPVYVSCNSCLPKAMAFLPQDINLDFTTYNSTEFTASIEGLIPKEKYTYTYSTSDANWPVKIYPASGSFISSSTSYDIPSQLTFCNSTGVCPQNEDNVLNYEIDPECLTQNYFSSIKLNIQPESCEYDNIDSNIMYVTCKDCLPKPVAALPTRLSFTNQTNNYAEITAIVSGIIPNHEYGYSFRSLDANWPIYIENSTGVLISPVDTYCIKAYVEFCSNTGVCSSGVNNVLNFKLPDNCFLQEDDYEARVVLDISSLGCEDNAVSSNIMHMSCKQCFPPTVSVKIPSPFLSLDQDVSQEFITNITNLEKDKLYTYRIESVYSNWPIFVFKPSGYIQPTTNSYDLVSSINFCSSTGLCPIGYKGVLEYALENENIPHQYSSAFKKYAMVNVIISEEDCPTKTYVSNRLLLECNNCVEPSSGISLVSVNIT